MGTLSSSHFAPSRCFDCIWLESASLSLNFQLTHIDYATSGTGTKQTCNPILEVRVFMWLECYSPMHTSDWVSLNRVKCFLGQQPLLDMHCFPLICCCGNGVTSKWVFLSKISRGQSGFDVRTNIPFGEAHVWTKLRQINRQGGQSSSSSVKILLRGNTTLIVLASNHELSSISCLIGCLVSFREARLAKVTRSFHQITTSDFCYNQISPYLSGCKTII